MSQASRRKWKKERRRRKRRGRCIDSVDLLSEILSRLPVKTVIRFQCVSKHWLSVISNSEFQRKHTQRSLISNPDLIFKVYGLFFLFQYREPSGRYLHISVPLTGGSCFTRVPPVPFLDSVGYTMEHYCNGLLLCWTKYHYVVCNPTTHKQAIVPIPEPVPDRRTSYLAFDASKSPFYKILALKRGSGGSEFHIYSSETGSWHAARFHTFSFKYTKSLYWNGWLHWIIDSGRGMVRLNTDTEELSILTLELPVSEYSIPRLVYFGECEGKFLLMVSIRHSDRIFVIFEMDKDYSGWRERWTCRVDDESILSDYRSKVMWVLKVEEGNAYELVIGDNCRILSYNTQLNCSKVLSHWPSIDLIGMPVRSHEDVHPLVECLVPV